MTSRQTDKDSDAVRDAFPLRLGTAEHFAAAREFFRTSGFNEPTILNVLKLGDMADLSGIKLDEVEIKPASETLLLLIRLFLFTEPAPRMKVERLIDAGSLESLLALDMIRLGHLPAYQDDEVYYTPVFVYPVDEFVVASDRRSNPDGSGFTPPPDIVFPAIFGGTLFFLKMIGKQPARSVLDLCSGSGIGALVLSKICDRVVAADITPRATHFAHFNCQLNERTNVDVVRGDLYQPVAGEKFDRVIAHPPYVPTLQKTAIYRDGGETGEIISKRIVEGLPEHLQPGGTFYSVCMGLDTNDARFEHRARSWLGESQAEFDVLFGLSDDRAPKDFAVETVVAAHGYEIGDVRRWEEFFREAGVRKLVYGVLVIHRLAAGSELEPATVRLRTSTHTDGNAFDRWISWRHWRQRADALESLAKTRARLSAHTRLRVTHTMQDAALLPTEFMLETDRPFLAGSRIDASIAQVVAELNGARSFEEIFEAARELGVLADVVTLGDFLATMASLIERGFVELDTIPGS
ncbi:MAG TPA: methyltransferase [Blastocatellia bacterium]|nr:methyltransferase [Blastocatellia bacterium]